MSKIIILPNLKFCKYGKLIKLNILDNVNLCDLLLDNNLNIPHFCEKFGKCTTCIVILKEGVHFFKNISFEESESLNKIFNKNLNIRLSCQLILNKICFDNINIILKIPD